MTRTWTRRSFLQLVVASLATTGCNLNPEPPLRVGAIIWPGHECLFIARSLRLFDSHPIKLVEYSSAPEVMRAFKNRAIEVAALTADELLRLAVDQPDLRVILVMAVSKGADAIIGRPEHASLSDLRGKKIGVEVNAVGVYMLSQALKSVGLKSDDVQPIPLENDQHCKAFADGKVDAVVSFEPHRSKILKCGGRVLFDSSKMSGEIVDYLVTRESVLNERAPALKAIVRGWFDARERLLTDGDEAARLVTAREGVTAPEFLKFFDQIDLPSIQKNKEMLVSSDRTMANLKRTHGIMSEYGLISGALPVTPLLAGGFLP